MKHGFTLIELSIVLVIVGLIVGGVLTGQALIKAAQLRSDISQYEKIEIAANTFRVKYNCMAGDCKNASTLFTGAINGDGSKRLDGLTINYVSSFGGYYEADNFSSNSEITHFMDHLARAELIEGEPLSNTSSTNNINTSINANTLLPKSHKGVPMVVSHLPRDGKHWLQTGVMYNSANITCVSNCTGGGIGSIGQYSGSDLFAIDSKIDDGIPSSGRVVWMLGYRWVATDNSWRYSGWQSASHCSITDASQYLAGSDEVHHTCQLAIKMSF